MQLKMWKMFYIVLLFEWRQNVQSELNDTAHKKTCNSFSNTNSIEKLIFASTLMTAILFVLCDVEPLLFFPFKMLLGVLLFCLVFIKVVLLGMSRLFP